MVSLTASGEIFSLRAPFDAQSQEGWLTADGEAVIGADVMAELSLCHGISAAVGAEIALGVNANLGALHLLGIGGDASASAEAGAVARGRVSGNVFDDFGVTLGVGASATARAQAEVELVANPTLIAEGAAALIGADSTAYSMFLAFLNEVRIGGGVRGRASAGAAAYAIASVAGNLLEDPARLEITAEADAALGAGAGGKAFFACELADPRRMALTIAELAATDIADEARRVLPESQHFIVEWFELLAPATTAIVWEVAQCTAIGVLAPPEEMADRFTDAILGRLQTLLLDKAVEVGFGLVNEGLADLGLRLRLSDDPALRSSLAADLRALANSLPDRRVSLPELGDLLGQLVNLLDRAGQLMTGGDVRRPLALMWTAAACGAALRDPAGAGAGASASAEVRVIGAGRLAGASAGSILPLAQPPDWVRVEWSAALNRAVTGPVSFADGVDALVALGLGPLMEEREPLRPLLREIGLALDLSVGDLVETAIGLVGGQPLTGTPTYRALRDLLIRQVNDLLIGQFVPAMQGALPPGSEGATWLAEGVVPSLLGVRHFVVSRVDAYVGGVASGDLTVFLSDFRAALGVLAGKVILRNVSVLQYALAELLAREVPPRLRSVARDIEAGRLEDPATFGIVTAWRGPAESLISVPLAGSVISLVVDEAVFRTAYTRLLVGLIDISADSFAIPAAAERERLYRLQLRSLLVDDLGTDYSSIDSFADLARSLADCTFLPNPDPTIEYAIRTAAVLATKTAFVAARAVPLLVEFHKEVSAPAVRIVQDAFVALLVDLDEARRAAMAQVRLIDRLVQDATEQLRAAIAEFDQRVREVRTALRSPVVRAQVVERIRRAGREAAVEVAGAAGGVAFDGVWTVASPVLDPVLDVLGSAAGAASTVLGAAGDATDAVSRASTYLRAMALDVLQAIDLAGLATYLGAADIADAVAAAAEIPLVTARLRAAGAAAGSRAALQRRRDDAVAERDAARARRNLAEAGRAAVTRTRVRPRIVSPVAFAMRRSGPGVVATAGVPELRVLLAGGDHRLLAPGDGRRLFVRLNGQDLELTGQHLVGSGSGECVLVRPLSSRDGLRAGVNVVECTVLGPGGAVGDHVAFVAIPDRKIPRSGVRIDVGSSRLDVDGDDHLAPDLEHVTLANTGRGTLDLDGWTVLDRAGHAYRFGPTKLAAGQRIQLHTGVGADTVHVRFWGRRRAVWNNRGDTITLVRPDGLVHESLSVRPKGARR